MGTAVVGCWPQSGAWLPWSLAAGAGGSGGGLDPRRCALTRAAAPQRLDAFGIGLDIAAQMLITAGDINDRFPQRGRSRKDVRRVPDLRQFRQDERPTPPQPGWQPSSERSDLPRRARRIPGTSPRRHVVATPRSDFTRVVDRLHTAELDSRSVGHKLVTNVVARPVIGDRIWVLRVACGEQVAEPGGGL
jgi:hypothetical protein